jgi:SAM-dependent methyltransferase
MYNPSATHRRMQEHYEQVWQKDAWDLVGSSYEQARFDFQLALVNDRRYTSILEIGCGSGSFTRRLMGLTDRLLAMDIASAAIERARVSIGEPKTGSVELRVANIMEYDPVAEGPWDLIIFSETIYCLGWLYPFSEIGWLAAKLLAATRDGGQLLLANTYGRHSDWLLQPWLIDTYRDLFANVGYQIAREQTFHGTKDETDFRVPMTLFVKSPEGQSTIP